MTIQARFGLLGRSCCPWCAGSGDIEDGEGLVWPCFCGRPGSGRLFAFPSAAVRFVLFGLRDFRTDTVQAGGPGFGGGVRGWSGESTHSNQWTLVSNFFSNPHSTVFCRFFGGSSS